MIAETTPFLVFECGVERPTTFGDSGEGVRRVIPITGGTVSGEIGGRVLPGGADWQSVLPDGTIELSAHYSLEFADGARVEVTSIGLRAAPPEVMAALNRGETVDPDSYYFRTHMRLRTGHAAYAHLNRSLFLGRGARAPMGVRIEVFRVL
jgi:hypothetical protein